ncbi:MAG: CooT family nickel-binding protein [Proteobacteria bacterium]|nr:CooT family nickel-binding protein [Pseudomonadota bacterium]
MICGRPGAYCGLWATNACRLRQGEETLISENAAFLWQKDETVELRDLFGQGRIISGEPKEIQFLDRKILIE